MEFSRREEQRAFRPTGAAGGPRRLLTVCLMLVVVVLLMRQAGRPELYERFFAALGAPLQPRASAVPSGDAASGQPRRVPAEYRTPSTVDRDSTDAATDDPLTMRRAQSLVAGLNREQLQSLDHRLAELRRARLADGAADLSPFQPPVPSPADDADLWEAVRTGDPATRPVLEALTDSVDRRTLSQLRDAARFGPDDQDAFYRALERATDPPRTSAVAIDLRALRAQPDAHRGQLVELAAIAVRAKRLEAIENPYGVLSYWMVWAVSDDPSHEPLVVYATRVPDAIGRLPADGQRGGPQIVIEGVFLRNQLYASASGVELAPVIVGRLTAVESLAGQTERLAQGAADRNGRMYVAAAVLGTVIGGALLIWFHRDRRSMRRLRRYGQPAVLAAGGRAPAEHHDEGDRS